MPARKPSFGAESSTEAAGGTACGRWTNYHRQESGLLEPDVDDDPEWVVRDPAPADRFAATLTRAKLRERLTDTVYSFRATRTIFRAYQFRPVIRLLQTGQLRLLIADEVGLGKTIEAGLVWTSSMESGRRKSSRRVSFDAGYKVAGGDAGRALPTTASWNSIERSLTRCSNGLPDASSGLLRCAESIERLRVWGGLRGARRVGAPRFDLVIVDEATSSETPGEKSHAWGTPLQTGRCPRVSLSATPLNLGNDDLYSLLELLAPGEFDDRFVLEQRLEPNAVRAQRQHVRAGLERGQVALAQHRESEFRPCGDVPSGVPGARGVAAE